MKTAAESTVEREALRRYVRARAPDFGAGERRELEAWLASDTGHQTAFDDLAQTWASLDRVADAFADERAALMRRRPAPRRPAWQWLLGALAAGATAVVVATILLPSAAVPRHFETAVAQQRTINLPKGVDVVLNADTAIDVADGEMTRIRLTRGDIYVDVQPAASGRVEVQVGNAIIRDIGTRFAVARKNDGATLAVEEGQVELRAGPAFLQVPAGQGADFDDGGHVSSRPLAAYAVAPWRQRRWQFDDTTLAALSAELARQQAIRVDIDDPAVAALTVSGNFRFDEPERVLWAVSQVHGLRLERKGERHFGLLRQ